MVKLLYKPIGLLVGVLGGMLAGAIFKKIWKLAAREDEAPRATDAYTNFGHYNKVYGSIAGVIIFLIWMWISNIAILFGAEFNAELERGRAIAAGAPPDAEPYVELRDTRKLRKTARRRQRTAG